MIVLRRSDERGHVVRPGHEVWRTFFEKGGSAPDVDAFGVLVILNESRFAPRSTTGVSSEEREAEVVTYVLEGAIAFEDSKGSSGVIHAGEFRRMTAECRIRYRERNALENDWTHVFEIGLTSRSERVKAGCEAEQRRFTLAERQGLLCTIASTDGRAASLRVNQDAAIYSAVLSPGQHVVHELLPGRKAWVQLVAGEVILGDVVLSAGDGAGVTAARSVALTARAESELLLVDLAELNALVRVPVTEERFRPPVLSNGI